MSEERWQSRFGGQEWLTTSEGVYLRGQEHPIRSSGDPLTCYAILAIGQGAINIAAREHGVSVALLTMTIAVETGSLRKVGFTGPRTFRWEPHIADYSCGPMQTLSRTARSMLERYYPNQDAEVFTPQFDRKPSPTPTTLPLYAFITSVRVGAAYIREQWPQTQGDPILVAASYNAGGLYASEGNAWGLRSTGDHLDRAARFYGDACGILQQQRETM